MLRFFERLDALERELKDQQDINELILAYIDADLEKPWEPAARALAAKLREKLKK
jgi:hypothetical protein